MADNFHALYRVRSLDDVKEKMKEGITCFACGGFVQLNDEDMEKLESDTNLVDGAVIPEEFPAGLAGQICPACRNITARVQGFMAATTLINQGYVIQGDALLMKLDANLPKAMAAIKAIRDREMKLPKV